MRTRFLGLLVCGLVASTAGVASADGPETRDYHPVRSAAGRCLDAAQRARPLAADCADTPSQRWKLAPVKGGFYTLTTEASGASWCLDVVNDGKANNHLRLATCGDASGQHWKLAPVDAGGYVLTTEWRGDKQCLAMGIDGTDIVPLLAPCADVAAQHWGVATAAKADRPSGPADDATKLDGEIAIPRALKPNFLLVFAEGCAMSVPDLPDAVATVLECARSGSAVTCTVRSMTAMLDLTSESMRPQHAFTASVSTDTRDTLTFTTPNGALKVQTALKDKSSKLTQRGSGRSGVCEGIYLLPARWAQFKADVGMPAAARHADPVPDDGDDDGDGDGQRDRPSPSRPAAPAKKKGLDRGRMCGKDKECDSGTCKMENRTRGRCS